MDPVDTGTRTTPLINRCRDITELAAIIACSAEELIDRLSDEPALADLAKTIREFADTLRRLQLHLCGPRVIPLRLESSIKTSLDDFHASLIQLQGQIPKVAAGSSSHQLQSNPQSWLPADIQTERRVLGLKLQLLTTILQQLNDTEDQDTRLNTGPEGSANPILVDIASISLGDQSPATELVIRSLSPDGNPPTMPTQSGSTDHYGVKGTVKPIPSSKESPPEAPSSDHVAGQSNAAQQTTRLSGSQKRFTQSFTWKFTSKGRQLAARLCQACEENDLEWVRTLLTQGAYVDGHNVNDPGNTQNTPLILAIKSNAIGIVETLLGSGADVDLPAADEKTPLSLEIDKIIDTNSDNFRILSLLLSHGANVNTIIDNRTLLDVALKYGRADLVDFLLLRGAKVKLYRFLHRAMIIKDTHKAQKIGTSLLRAGAPPDPDSRHGFYPLLYACNDLKSLSWVKLLVSHGADPSIVYKESTQLTDGFSLFRPSLLHVVARATNGSPILEYLLSQKVDVNAECRLLWKGDKTTVRVRNEVTPLHLAVTAANAYSLIKHGASVSTRDSEGCTPLFWASERVNSEVIKANLTEGSPVNARAVDGRTALHCLVATLLAVTTARVQKGPIDNFYTCAKLLVDAGARVDLGGNNNRITVYQLVSKQRPTFYDKISPDGSECPKHEGKGPREIFDDIRALIMTSGQGNIPADVRASDLARPPSKLAQPSSPAPKRSSTIMPNGNHAEPQNPLVPPNTPTGTSNPS